jgi:phosphate transport system permease protein
MTIDDSTLAVANVADIDDVPMTPAGHHTPADRAFRGLSTAAACVSLAIIGGTLIFLVDRARPAFKTSGIWDFFTTSVWNPAAGRFGVLGLLEGTLIIASIAMVIAVPMAVGMALFINEYAPTRIRRILTTMVDLLAALPSLLFGIWVLKSLQRHLAPVATFLNHHLSVLPFMHVKPGSALTGSSFIAGVVVALMILPIVTSVSRDVMAQVPREQCEGALALGGTRWGMIRSVVLPCGRGAVIGGTMLGLGRALGETIAVVMIISPRFVIQPHILENGTSSVSSLIALRYGEASPFGISALMAAGVALFVMTLVVNFAAASVVARSRSGAVSEA